MSKPIKGTPKSVKVLVEVELKPAEGNDSDFWDLGATPFLVASQIAEKMLGDEAHGHRIYAVRPGD